MIVHCATEGQSDLEFSSYALRQNRSMPFTAGVDSADPVFNPLFVDFLIVGDFFAVRAITKNRSIRWMVNAKVFHEILQ